MRVRAIKLGYYDLKRRREGEEFELLEAVVTDKEGNETVIEAAASFSPKWMEEIDDLPPVPVKKSRAEKVRHQEAPKKASGDEDVLL